MSDIPSAKALVKKAHSLLQAIQIAEAEQDRRLPFAADVSSFLEEARTFLNSTDDEDGGAA
ncbi:MAG: hypothetical protein KF895_02565 [Parvibaculum sp.]|nr:hypothetical protein [Parvibaculum sp.]